LDEDEKGMFLTKEEHDKSYYDLHGDETEPQSKYLEGYQHAILEMKN